MVRKRMRVGFRFVEPHAELQLCVTYDALYRDDPLIVIIVMMEPLG